MKKRYLYSLLIIFAIVILYILEQSSIYETTPAMQQEAVDLVDKTNKQSPLNSFAQDGCTLFPNQLPWHDFRPACLEHDMIYWIGGSESERKTADVAFRDTISHTGPIGPVFAYTMYYGVRLFGDTWLTKQLDSNWGYGWNK